MRDEFLSLEGLRPAPCSCAVREDHHHPSTKDIILSFTHSVVALPKIKITTPQLSL